MFTLLLQFFLWTSTGQTLLAKRATSYLGQKLNTTVTIDKVDISFFKFFRLENLYIEDQNSDTLVFIQTIDFELNDFHIVNDTFRLLLNSIELTRPSYFLHQLKGDSVSNIRFIIDAFANNDTNKSGSVVFVDVLNLKVNDGTFRWNDENYTETDFGINWDHVAMNNIDLTVSDFRIINDTFLCNFNHFSLVEQSGFILSNFTGEALFSPVMTKVNHLHIRTPYSSVFTNLEYTYETIKAYTNFNEEVYMRYTIDTSLISVRDVAYFAPALKGLEYNITICGKERGPVSDIKFSKLFVKYGKETELNGRVFISGLPDIESTSFNCKFKKLSTNYADLSTIKRYPFTENKTISLPDFLRNVGTVQYVGSYNGFYNNFVTYGTFTSANGQVQTDLQLAPDDIGLVSYSGNIKTSRFNLADITGMPGLFGLASVDIRVEGQNLDFKTLDLTLKGTASHFDFNGYSYTDIEVDGKVQNQTISGLLNVADTNVSLAFDGSIALNEELPKYKFNAQIKHLRPKQLHLMNRDSSASLTTEVIFNFKGDNLDNIVGRAGLRNFYFIENGEEVNLKAVDLLALSEGRSKTLSLTSENINLLITGEYYFGEAFESLEYLTYKWLPKMFSRPIPKPKSIQKFKAKLDVHGFSGFSNIFLPEVTFENDLTLEIDFDSEKELLNFRLNSPKMSFIGRNTENFGMIAKISPDTFLLISESDKLYLSMDNFIERFQVKARASQDKIVSEIHWDNQASIDKNSGSILSELIFSDATNFEITFTESSILIHDTLWTITDSSKIIRNGSTFLFDHLTLTQGNQNIRLNGQISEDPSKQLAIKLDSFNLQNINPLLDGFGMDIHGVMDGQSVITDFYGSTSLLSNLTFNNLIFNQQRIGNGNVRSIWDDIHKKFDLDIRFTNDTLKPITIEGDYYPKRKTNQLNLLVELDHFPLPVLKPFFGGNVSKIDGTVSGKASLEGEVNRMLFNGDLELNDVAMHIDYLNETVYLNHQKLFIRPYLLGADAVTVTDKNGNRALVNFSLFHNNFSEMNFDLDVLSLDVFRVFHTNSEDNEYFYGDIYLNPHSSINLSSDYEGNLSIAANVISGPGTAVYVPFFDDSEVGETSYIYFKSTKKDSIKSITNSATIPSAEDPFSLSIDMAMELNKEAEIILLMDEFSSDKIQAHGEGSINLILTHEGDFEMFGNYEIHEGFYLFTFSKLISKKFTIDPGSRLTWNGDPYEGIANITATYKVRTTLYDLGPIVTAAYDTSELKRRIPIDVKLKMTNNYMKPDLEFSFYLPPKYDEIASLMNGLDEGDRNKQVFSLLILNKFMPISGGDVTGGTGALATNSTEVLSNQLSNWLSSISKDIDVGVRYNPGDQISGDEVEVALSTQLFNDRVYLETNFGYSNTANRLNNTQNSNFVGEFTLSYKINKKGNIVGKIFNRSNELNPVYNNISPYTQGVGISYSESFNTWKNLGCIMANHFKRRDKKRDCTSEYYQELEANKEERRAKIERIIAKSRKKHDKHIHIQAVN